jgi:multicomponent Na+:H+ antiporter subunit B
VRPLKMTMREKVVLRVTGRGFIPVVLLFGLYVQVHGDFGPGGGFQAGVIFAAAFILYAMIFGLDSVKQVLPPAVVEYGSAAGVVLYGGVGVVTLLRGGAFLDYDHLVAHAEDAAGHASTHGQHMGILLVELGVGITVACVMISIYYTFSGRRRLS